MSDPIIPDYPRDMTGYGQCLPQANWPDNARVALNFVVNYEEGGERTILDGDGVSECYLVPDFPAGESLTGQRSPLVEDLYEYGSRVGIWRYLRLFRERELHFTCFGVGIALARNPEAATTMVADGHEIAGHHWRWLDYSQVPEEVEREHVRWCQQTIESFTGEPLAGWYTGRFGPNSRRLVAEETQTIYDSDAYNDELPYWILLNDQPRLIVPYSLETNDFKFSLSPGWTSGTDFFDYLKASFDQLYAEGAECPRMMSIGLHCRLGARPGRAHALARFLDYVQSKPQVWITTRADIARHWMTHFPYR